jgi:hypothetical protein
MLGEEAFDRIVLREIAFGMERDEDTAAAHLPKPPDQVTPEESRSARNHDSLVRKTDHECLP